LKSHRVMEKTQNHKGRGGALGEADREDRQKTTRKKLPKK